MLMTPSLDGICGHARPQISARGVSRGHLVKLRFPFTPWDMLVYAIFMVFTEAGNVKTPMLGRPVLTGAEFGCDEEIASHAFVRI